MGAKRLYFAYGANLSVEAMLQRCAAAGARKLGPATLPGHRLEFRQDDYGFGVANVVPARGREVPGGLWLITRKSQDSLNRHEAYPRVYVKKWVRVVFRGKTVRAITYVLKDERPAAMPDGEYVRTILQGYDDFGLDKNAFQDAVRRTGRRHACQGKWPAGPDGAP